MFNEFEKIFKDISDEERECLEKIYSYFTMMPSEFNEAFDNMYFDTDCFEELILKYAELIKFNKQLYDRID